MLSSVAARPGAIGHVSFSFLQYDDRVRALVEEYHYELDRNESFRMLVDVLVTERARATPGLEKMVDMFMAQAVRSRAAAEERARAGDFAAAVTGLEEATKHIGRAIRSAGIYIPGS